MEKDYTPDSIYTLCGEFTNDCPVCSNSLYSPVVGGKVHDSQRGKVFCPFGKGSSMNTSVFLDQGRLNFNNITHNQNYTQTPWGRVPQLDPRPLSRIGLSWRTS